MKRVNRDEVAQKAATRRLARAFDYFRVGSQEAADAGHEVEAAGLNAYADWCLRAYVAECVDRKPEGL